jgi:hypothetical protein
MCAAYPPNGDRSVDPVVADSGAIHEDPCDPTPRHGFQSACSSPGGGGSGGGVGCDVAGVGVGGGLADASAWSLAMAAALAGRRRRLRGGSP